MTPIILIFGQSNAAFLDNSQALEGAIEAQGGTVLEVGVHGGSQSAALPGGHWNIIDDDGDATGGSSYTRLLETMERVLADNPDSYIAGAVWVQGEQDSQRHLIGEYYDPVATLFTQMRDDLGEDFLISMVGPSDFQSTDPVSRAHIRETQQQLAQDLPDTYFVDTDAIIAENNLTKDEVMRDDLHYTDDFFDHIAQAVLEEPALRQALQLQQQGAATEPEVEDPEASAVIEDVEPTPEEPVQEPVVADPEPAPEMPEVALIADEPAPEPTPEEPAEEPVVADPEPAPETPEVAPVADAPAPEPTPEEPAEEPVVADPEPAPETPEVALVADEPAPEPTAEEPAEEPVVADPEPAPETPEVALVADEPAPEPTPEEPAEEPVVADPEPAPEVERDDDLDDDRVITLIVAEPQTTEDDVEPAVDNLADEPEDDPIEDMVQEEAIEPEPSGISAFFASIMNFFRSIFGGKSKEGDTETVDPVAQSSDAVQDSFLLSALLPVTPLSEPSAQSSEEMPDEDDDNDPAVYY